MEVQGKRVALVSQHILRVGDSVWGYRVVEIERSRVVLQQGEGRRIVLTLPGDLGDMR